MRIDMIKKLIPYVFIGFSVGLIIDAAIINRFRYPVLTETQLFIKEWKSITLSILFLFIAGFIISKQEKSGN